MDTSSNEIDELRRKVEAELLPGEELLWVGRGDGRLNARSLLGTPLSAFLVMVMVGILILASFAGLFISRGIFFSGTSLLLPMISIFAIMAIVMMLVVLRTSGVLARIFRNTQATYAITDRRIMILSGRGTTQVTSYGPQDIECIERRMRDDGSGDLVFRYDDLPRRAGGSYSSRRMSYDRLPVGFFGIADVRRVEALLIDTFRPEPDSRDGDIEARTLDSLLGTDRLKRKRASLVDGDPIQDNDLIDLADLTVPPDDNAATTDG